MEKHANLSACPSEVNTSHKMYNVDLDNAKPYFMTSYILPTLFGFNSLLFSGSLWPVVAVFPRVTMATLPLHLCHHFVRHLIPWPPICPVAEGSDRNFTC